MFGNESRTLGRALTAGVLTGFVLAIVVSAGILVLRLQGLSAPQAATANALTTGAALLAASATVHALFRTVTRQTKRGGDRLLMAQALGAVGGVLAVHLAVHHSLQGHPWVREHPRQLVNDLVAVFGVLSFVWGCAKEPIRKLSLIGGLALVLAYEVTAHYWHMDGPSPFASGEWPTSVQGFVGSEVTASGLGLLAFRLLRG